VIVEPARDRQRVRVVALDSQRQRLDACRNRNALNGLSAAPVLRKRTVRTRPM